MFACMYGCISHVFGVQGGKKTALDLLELKIQIVLTPCVCAGN